MTLTVELKPEVQAELARQAASNGKPVEAYAASLLEEAVHLPAPPANDLFELFVDCSRMLNSISATILPLIIQSRCGDRLSARRHIEAPLVALYKNHMSADDTIGK
jgi:hypothetical protein